MLKFNVFFFFRFNTMGRIQKVVVGNRKTSALVVSSGSLLVLGTWDSVLGSTVVVLLGVVSDSSGMETFVGLALEPIPRQDLAN